MKRLSSFIKATLMGALALGAMAPWIATAATGPWSWHDISDQLTEKNNRPIWAMAHDNDGWFYTDGQNLFNGGQVYRYDGSTQVNITNDVRSAGIDRVDDIVSDNAGTVLFLKNVQAKNNTLDVISYNGSYTNLTSQVRGYLQSNEGLAQIVGRNGTWAIVTTQGRVLFYTPSTNTFRVVRGIGPSYWTLNYNTTHVSVSDNRSIHLDETIQPLNDGSWLLARFEEGPGAVFERVSVDGQISSIATQPNLDYVDFMASNGNQVIMGGVVGEGSMNISIFDGTSFRDVTSLYSTIRTASQGTSIKGPGMQIYWTGSSWMIIYNDSDAQVWNAKKSLWRFDGSSFQYLGEPRDYFVTGASDGDGRVLLGGAASTLGLRQPTTPLTAKLAMVIEDGGTSEGTTSNGTTVTSGGTFGGDRVFTSANGPRVTIQGNPSGFRVKNGGEFAYRTTASDSNGVDRIDLYVNDARIQTCKADSCEYRTTYYLKTATTRTVKFWVRVTDKDGNSTDTSGNPDTLTIDANSNATADGSITNTSTNSTQSNTGNGISTWDWIDPVVSSFNGGDSLAYNVGAWDADGISQIQIIANGSVKQTCNLNNATGNVQCSATLYANDYGANTNVFVNAKVLDAKGNTVWTTGKNIYRNATVGTSSYTGTANATISEYFTPDVTSFNSNDSVGYRVTAQDNDGISRIDLYANGTIRQTCDVGNATGNIQCSTTVYASDYGSNGNVLVNAKVTDVFGNTTWSTGRTIYRNSGSGSNATNASISESFMPNDSSFGGDAMNDVILYRVNAVDSDGISRIDLYANGSIKQTCTFGNTTGNAQCSTTLYANDYSANSSINVNAKVTDANGNTTWTNGKNITRNSSTGSESGSTNATVSDSLAVNASSFGPNESATYRADAQDNDGISRIQILVNGSAKQTCDFNNATGNVQCTATLYANDYAANANVFVNAKVTDRFGNVTWTSGRNIYRNGATNGSNNSSNVETSRSVWLDPNQTDLLDNSRITFNVNAQDQNGLNRVEIYSNGSARKTCTLSGTTSNATCSFELFASDYSLNTDVTVNAKITDSLGNVVWTESKVIRRTSSGSAGTTSDQISSWDWLNPGVASIPQNDRIEYHVGTWASAGVKDITIYVNGNALPACTFTYGTGNVECWKELKGADYATNATVFVNAKIHNMNGREIWTTGRSFTITTSGSNSNSGSQTNPHVNANGSVTAWSNTANYGNSDAITISASASDPDGVQRIEIYMNAERMKTCYGTTCSVATSKYSLYPSNLYHAVVFDAYGNYTVSETKTVFHR